MTRRTRPIPSIPALLLLLATTASAGLFDSPLNESSRAAPEATVSLLLLSDDPRAGGTVQLGVRYDVPEGAHMTATFTDMDFAGEPEAVFGQPVFPDPVASEIPYYKGDVMAVVPVTLSASAGELRLHVSAAYQLCTEGRGSLCFPPARAEAELVIDVGEGEAAPAAPAPVASGGGLQGRLMAALEGGSWLAFLLVFLGGVLASLTPCVFPMIPITISFIGMSAKGNPLKGFVMSLWYVLGIALVYSTLGLIAAAGGSAFGQATQTPVFMGFVAAIIFAMGLSMAGLYDIQLPSSLTTRVGGGRTGFLGPLLMGMAMGLVAAPCVGPIIVVLLTWVATTGSLFLGFWLLFTFALGLGLLFVVLGTFGGLLPPGGWMVTVKHVFAVILFALAPWFLRAWLPDWAPPLFFGVCLMLAVSAWGVFKPLTAEATARESLAKGIMRFLWILGLALTLLSGLRGFAPQLLPAGAPIAGEDARHEPAWMSDEAAAFAAAAAERKPLVMDFWAEWCAACKELDHKTWSRPEVAALAEDFIALKMDMTDRGSETDALNAKYGVVGMPTVIFFDPDGREVDRFSGFKDADEVAALMERVLSSAR